MDLDRSVHAHPVTGERKVGARHHFETEDIDVELPGGFEVTGTHEKVIQFFDRHASSPVRTLHQKARADAHAISARARIQSSIPAWGCKPSAPCA